MSCHAGRSNQNAETVFSCGNCKISGFDGSSVSRINVYFKGNTEGFQHVGCFLDNRQIGIAAHNNTNFFHNYLQKTKKSAISLYSQMRPDGRQIKLPVPLWCSTIPSVAESISKSNSFYHGSQKLSRNICARQQILTNYTPSAPSPP